MPKMIHGCNPYPKRNIARCILGLTGGVFIRKKKPMYPSFARNNEESNGNGKGPSCYVLAVLLGVALIMIAILYNNLRVESARASRKEAEAAYNEKELEAVRVREGQEALNAREAGRRAEAAAVFEEEQAVSEQ